MPVHPLAPDGAEQHPGARLAGVGAGGANRCVGCPDQPAAAPCGKAVRGERNRKICFHENSFSADTCPVIPPRASGAPRGRRRARRRDAAGAVYLVGFVSLAAQQDDVARPRRADRVADCFRPVRNDRVLAFAVNARQDVPDDGGGILVPAVVRRNDHCVRQPRGDASHQPALAAVAVAAAPEQQDDAPRTLPRTARLAAQPVEGQEQALQRIGRVRIVDENRERCAAGRDTFQPSRDAREPRPALPGSAGERYPAPVPPPRQPMHWRP